MCAKAREDVECTRSEVSDKTKRRKIQTEDITVRVKSILDSLYFWFSNKVLRSLALRVSCSFSNTVLTNAAL